MKKISVLLLLFCSVWSVSAQLANGYYRVKNKVTARYATLRDNTFAINKTATDADLSALMTIRDYNKIICDPGSIIYIEHHGNNNYVLKAQGTDTKTATGGEYLKILARQGGYWAYATNNGMTKYLTDERDPNFEFDDSYVITTDDKTRVWYIQPLNSTDNYLGLTPSLSDGTYYYQTFYASFPFSFASSDVQAFIIDKVVDGYAIIKEVVGEVPGATPVIVRSKSNQADVNKVNVLVNSSATVSGNKLKGNYFNYARRNNQTAYNPSTMRVLGVLSNGSVGLLKSSTLDYLPINSAYLPVLEGTPEELKLVTQAEYDEIVASSIESLNVDKEAKVVRIHTLDGKQGAFGSVRLVEYSDGRVVKKIIR